MPTLWRADPYLQRVRPTPQAETARARLRALGKARQHRLAYAATKGTRALAKRGAYRSRAWPRVRTSVADPTAYPARRPARNFGGPRKFGKGALQLFLARDHRENAGLSLANRLHCSPGTGFANGSGDARPSLRRERATQRSGTGLLPRSAADGRLRQRRARRECVSASAARRGGRPGYAPSRLRNRPRSHASGSSRRISNSPPRTCSIANRLSGGTLPKRCAAMARWR